MGETTKSGESFLTKAISDDKFLWRALGLLAGVFVLGVLFAWFTVSQVARELKNLAGSHLDEVSYAGASLKFGGPHGDVYYLTVPAAQPYVNSGVALSTARRYRIRASGIVSTAPPTLDESFFEHEPYGPVPLLTYFWDAKADAAAPEFVSEAQRAMNLSWRDPNGKLIYRSDAVGQRPAPNKCGADKSDDLRVYPAEYGKLLALLVPQGQEPFERFERRGQSGTLVIPVGAQSDIFPDQIPEGYENGSLYFTVNDTVLLDEKEFELFDKCPPASWQEERAQGWRTFFRNVYDHPVEYHLDGQKRQWLWYLDNRGQFSVSISVEKK
jgi:hypothetical protein